MRKMKQRLLKCAEAMLMLLVIFLVSKLPVGIIQGLEWIAYGMFGVMFVVWLGVFVYRWRKIATVLLLLLSGTAYAIDEADCDNIQNAAEQDLCRYRAKESQNGDRICSYMKGFDPQRALTTPNAIDELAEIVKESNDLIQAHRRLQKSYQFDMDRCSLVSKEERDQSVRARTRLLHKNSNPICCAMAMQELNQLYVTANNDTRVKTVLALMADENMRCWPCEVIYLMTAVVNTVAWNAQPYTAAAGMFLAQWLFVFWLVFQIGFIFMGRMGAGDFFKKLLIQGLLLMLVSIILVPAAMQVDTTKRTDTTLDEAYKLVLSPPFELIAGTGINMASALLNGKQGLNDRIIEEGKKSPNAIDRQHVLKLQTFDYCSNWRAIESTSMYEKMQDISREKGYDIDNRASGRLISLDLMGGMLCLSQLAFSGTAAVGAMGSVFVSYAIENGYSLPFLPGSIPRIPQLVNGLALQIICWLLGVAVAFELMDVMLRLGFVLILTPIFIATSIFGITRHYSVVACRFFWNALMRFIEVALAVAIVVPFFFAALSGSDGDALVKAMVAPSSKDYVMNLYNASTGGSGKTFFVIIGVGWLAFKMLKASQAIFEDIFSLEQVAPKSDRYFNVGQGVMGRGPGGDIPSGMFRAVGASGGALNGTMNSVRKGIGGAAPVAGRLGKAVGNSRLGRSAKSAGARTFNRAKTALQHSRLGRGAAALKRFATNNKLTRGLQALGNTGIGKAAKFMVNNKVTRFAGRTAKAAVKATARGIGSAAKRGIKNFFFMDDEKKK